ISFSSSRDHRYLHSFPTRRSSDLDFIYINDFKINQLISKVDDFKVYYIREDIPNFKWQLQEEYKNINGVNLQKATTHFRGRNYRSEEHTSELQSRENLVCRLLLEK